MCACKFAHAGHERFIPDETDIEQSLPRALQVYVGSVRAAEPDNACITCRQIKIHCCHIFSCMSEVLPR
jgi:hypothetical protein